MAQTCESSSATASQLWRSVLMPSSPSSSPAIWNPVTWSRPSSDDTRVLKKPVRTAYSASKGSPTRNNVSPRRSVRRVPTSESSRASSRAEKPTGRHSSRRLQLEHATLSDSVEMGLEGAWGMAGAWVSMARRILDIASDRGIVRPGWGCRLAPRQIGGPVLTAQWPHHECNRCVARPAAGNRLVCRSAAQIRYPRPPLHLLPHRRPFRRSLWCP